MKRREKNLEELLTSENRRLKTADRRLFVELYRQKAMLAALEARIDSLEEDKWWSGDPWPGAGRPRAS